MPTTRTVSIRNFREHLAEFLREAEKNNVHFVVMRHAVPIARILPMEENTSLDSLINDVANARKAARKGKVYTAKQVRAMIG